MEMNPLPQKNGANQDGQQQANSQPAAKTEIVEIKAGEENKDGSKEPESQVEEVKGSSDGAQIDPALDLRRAMEELNIDPNDPNFNEQAMMDQFKTISEDRNKHFFVRDRFENLHKILQKHKFWETQPIMQARHQIKKEGQIQQFSKKEIPTEPLPLPPGFEWSTLDVTDDAQVDEVIDFLENHYVEDQVGNFRLKYSKEKFRWGAATPGYVKDLHFLVRNSKNGKILASIMGCPKKMVLCGKPINKMCEVNFLAVHASLRAKRMAQTVIQEMMRRKRMHGFMQAYYTSGHTMPTPFSTTHYMNRFINVDKLVKIQYTNCPAGMTIKDMIRKYKLPEKKGINIVGQIRKMDKKDVSEVLKLHQQQQQQYKAYYKLNQDEVRHFLLPKDDVVWTYVIENVDENGKKILTDFFSMYRLTQTCVSKEELGHKWDDMHSGCLYYYGLTKNTLSDMIKQCLWIAKEDMDCDAFSAMTNMENKTELFVEKLGFLPGDGALHWYLVNWALGDNEILSNDIGTILI